MIYLDGGMGTMLQAAGLRPGEDPTDWNLEHPEEVTAIHRQYVEAGSEVVLTNTFGATRLKYHGKHELSELIKAAVANAKASGAKKIALDVGPSGKLLKPIGDLDFEEAVAAFRELIAVGEGADIVFIETMGDLYELKAAIVAAKEFKMPIWTTVALGEDGKLLTGADVECYSTLMEGLGVEAYGFNCGLGPDKMLKYVERLSAVSTKPIIVKPNAGMPKLVEGKTVFEVGPKEFAVQVAKLQEAGATIIGGCCGTTPAHIREVAQ